MNQTVQVNYKSLYEAATVQRNRALDDNAALMAALSLMRAENEALRAKLTPEIPVEPQPAE